MRKYCGGSGHAWTANAQTTAVKAEDFTDDPRTDLLDSLPQVTQPGRNHACGRQVQSFGRPEHLRQRGECLLKVACMSPAQSGGISIGVVTGEVKIGLTEEVFRQQLESTVRSLSQEIIEATRTNDGDTVRRLTKEIDVANAKLADISGTLASREAELKSAYEKLDLIKDQLPTEQVARAKSFLLEGKTDLAEGLFDSIVHKGVSHIAESAFQSGQLAEGRFEYIKAYGSYRTAAALENNAPFWLAVGRVANVLGKFDEAVHFLVPPVEPIQK
jgi:hypothetical protein